MDGWKHEQVIQRASSLAPALLRAPRRWPGALAGRPTLLSVPVAPGCVQWFASSREPDGQDVVPHGAARSSAGRRTQTNNHSVRRCHGNLEEQSSTLRGDDLCASAGRRSTGNRDRGGQTAAGEGLPPGSGAWPLTCGDEGARGGFSGTEDEPRAFWFKHGSSPHYLCGLGTREPQLSLLAAVKSLDHHHHHRHPKA